MTVNVNLSSLKTDVDKVIAEMTKRIHEEFGR